jgi:sugar/nucleoside kinase (ribokinase family)
MNSSTIEILGIGAPIVDRIIYITEEELADIPGNKGGMEAVDYETFIRLLSSHSEVSELIPGGSCANALRGLAQLGRRCALIGKIGNDKIGEKFLHDLQSLGIKPLCLKTASPTGQVLSFVTPDGHRTCRTYLGACQEMSADDLDPSHFQNVKLVHIEGYTILYPGLTERTMEYAKNAGALISFDLASFEIASAFKKPLIDLLGRYVDICFANNEEILALTGLSMKEGCSALNQLCSIGVVLMGKNGCWVGNQQTLIECPAYPVEQPLDSTGAGDLFASGFLHGFLDKKPLEVCAHYGALAGAAVVQIQGASLPTQQWKELQTHMY